MLIFTEIQTDKNFGNTDQDSNALNLNIMLYCAENYDLINYYYI